MQSNLFLPRDNNKHVFLDIRFIPQQSQALAGVGLLKISVTIELINWSCRCVSTLPCQFNSRPELLTTAKSQQFDNTQTPSLYKRNIYLTINVYLTQTSFCRIFKSCVKAQMNRLSAPLWANVVCIVRDTTFIRKRKKESKIEEKITNFIELREEIVWLPKRSNCDTPALYKTVLYTAQPVSRCSIGAKEVQRINLWCHDRQ